MAKTSSKNYFTKETEEYIVRFNNSTDPEEKQRIFTDHIYYPFYKLAECIIHTFKFYNTDVDQLEDLKCDIVRMLYEEKIDKFDPSKGAKAYSYFGTIIKRYLIGYNEKNYRLKKKILPLENYKESSSEIVIEEPETSNILTLSQFMDAWVADVYSQFTSIFPDESEQRIADAVLTLFKTRQSLEIFQKKALYIYLKEITGSETVYVTKVILKLKENFYTKYKDFLDRGLIADSSS